MINHNRKPRRIITLLFIIAALLLFGFVEWRNYSFCRPRLDLHGLVEQRCIVEKVVLNSDKDGDGIYALDDIVQGASHLLRLNQALSAGSIYFG